MELNNSKRKPSIENIKNFLDWISIKFKEDPDFRKIYEMGIMYSKEEFMQFFEIFLHKDTFNMHPRKSLDGKMDNVAVYDRYESSDILEAFENAIGNEHLSFISETYAPSYSHILNFVFYATLEALFDEYFIGKVNNRNYHKDEVKRTCEILNKANSTDYPYDTFNTLFKKYVPENGISSTQGGEYIRGMMKILYHLYNDGDNPITYGYRKVAFWSYVNCMYVISKNYDLFLKSVVPPNYIDKGISEMPPAFYHDNDLCPFNLMSMIKFGINYIETENGKLTNENDFLEPVTEHFYNEGYFYSNA